MEQENLIRNSSKELDEILGKQFVVYDKGFVRCVDYMGNESSIVQAARVSYGKGTKTSNDDKNLIRYLLRHSHTTPIEMCEIKFHVKIEMDTWRQMVRHRTASINEYSTRYSEAIDDKHTTLPGEWRFQSNSNKQGSTGFLPIDKGIALSEKELELHRISTEIYKERIKEGVAREQARKDLPLSNYTEVYWKVDLHNLLHFLSLRLDSHAQFEIRQFSEVIANIVKLWVPNVWEAFNDYNFRRQAVLFTRLDISVINAFMTGGKEKMIETAKNLGWLAVKSDSSLKDNRERLEFEQKIAKLGIPIGWKS